MGELSNLKKIIDGHQRTLAFLAEEKGSEHVWLRLEDAFYQLEHDLNNEGRQIRHADASPPCTYDVLRNALNDSQRRVESLNNEATAERQLRNSAILRRREGYE